MKINLHQKAREETLAAILNASEKLFVDKGFSGTSIGAIAKEAKINQSLIYHYFQDKKALWREVKSHIITNTLGPEHLLQAPHIDSLDELLEHLVTRRLQLYSKNQNLVRMLLWQALEEEGETISGTSEAWIESWIKQIEALQKKKKITSSYTPYEIMISFNAIVWAPFLTGPFKGDINAFCKKKLQELKKTYSSEK